MKFLHLTLILLFRVQAVELRSIIEFIFDYYMDAL